MTSLLDGQIFVKDFKATRRLTNAALGVASFKWRSNSAGIYFVTQGI